MAAARNVHDARKAGRTRLGITGLGRSNDFAGRTGVRSQHVRSRGDEIPRGSIEEI